MSSDTPIVIVGKVSGSPSGSAAEASAPSVPVHHMPCKIGHDGPAKVSTYFIPEVTTEGKRVAYFRGRRLAGHHVVLPAGTTGLVVKEIQTATMVDGVIGTGKSAAAAGSSQATEVARQESLASTQSIKPAFWKATLPASKVGARGYSSGRSFGGGGGGGYGKKAVSRPADSGSEEEEDDDVGFIVDSDEDGEDESVDAADVPSSAFCTPMKGSAPNSETLQVRQWQIEGAFQECVYWLHDKSVSEVDPLRAALDWIEIAHAIHNPDVDVSV